MDVYYALDSLGVLDARFFVQQVSKKVNGVKFGWEFFSDFGLDGICAVMGDSKLPLLIDLKICDSSHKIYTTVKNIVEVAGPDFLTLRLTGDIEMIESAKKAVYDVMENRANEKGFDPISRRSHRPTKLLGCLDVPYFGRSFENVLELAHFAYLSGMDGVVCSPEHVNSLCNLIPSSNFIIVSTLESENAGEVERETLENVNFLVIEKNISMWEEPDKVIKTSFVC